MEKKEYLKPDMNIIQFGSEDIITESIGGDELPEVDPEAIDNNDLLG